MISPKSILISLISVLALTFSTIALADEPQTHQGFQFRATPGLGDMSDAQTTKNSTASDHINGLSGAAEFYLGGYILPRLALGGMLSEQYIPSPSVSSGNVSVSVPNSHANLFGLGPYADYYVLPGYGLHVMATVGYANILVLAAKQSQLGNGWDLGAGVGYDWSVSRDWSVGVLGRLGYSNLSLKSSTESVVSPALLFSVSYN